MRRACRCAVQDWTGIRHALGLTQDDMAAMLRCSRRTICRREGAEHVCSQGPLEGLLLAWLQDPARQRLLAEAGVPLPVGVRRVA